MESLPTRAQILCARGAVCACGASCYSRLTEYDKGKQDRLEEGNKIDSEDKDARFVTVARFVNAWHTCLPHFPLTNAK